MTSELYLAHSYRDQSFPLEQLNAGKSQNKDLDFIAVRNKVRRISGKITSHPKDTLWLLRKNEWAHNKLEKLTQLQKSGKISPENLQKIQNLYQRLINRLIAEIQVSPPPLMFKDAPSIKSLDIGETIAKFVNSTLDRIVRIIKHGFLFEKIDCLIGEHQRISPQALLFIEKFLNHSKVKMDLRENPVDYLNSLVDQLTLLREAQLKRLRKGKNALTSHDKLPNGISVQDIQKKANELIYLLMVNRGLFISDTASQNQYDEVLIHFSSMYENAIPRNTQAISDNPYPYCIFKNGNIPGTITRSISNMVKAETIEGPKKGFLEREHSYLSEKADWREVETKNDVFVKGFYRIQFISQDNHVALSGAWLDLSVFDDLDEKNTAKIFDLIATIIPTKFEILKKPKKELTKLEQMALESLKRDIHKIESEIQLSSKDIKKLRKVVLDFCYRMRNAMTLTLLTVNHDSRKLSLID